MRYLDVVLWNIDNIYIQNTIHHIYVICARWVLFVTPDSSSHLPCRSIRLLPPPLLVINSLSCYPLGGPGPPPFPQPRLTPFPSGSRHLPASLSDTNKPKYIQSGSSERLGPDQNFKTTIYFMVSVIDDVLFVNVYIED
jgi:hypothetical protein